jgi:hypothetical protein
MSELYPDWLPKRSLMHSEYVQLMAQGPPQSYLKKMADAEDAAGSISVGGMAADMGMPVRPNLPAFFMVFDVESIGLHGEGFAAGYVVIDSDGKEQEADVFACRPIDAGGDREDRSWVSANIPALPVTHDSPRGVRTAFFRRWLHWKDRGAVLVADCCWPVEARFLAACVDDHPQDHKWNGPYPLHDVASMLLMAGLDPVGSYWEEQDGVKHHPMCDAAQSARMLKQVLLSGSVH